MPRIETFGNPHQTAQFLISGAWLRPRVRGLMLQIKKMKCTDFSPKLYRKKNNKQIEPYL